MSAILQNARTQTGHAERVAAWSDLRRLPDWQSPDWLNPIEHGELDRLRNPRRREAWLGGRWLAKMLVREHCDFASCDLSAIAVTSRNGRAESVRPAVFVDGARFPCSLSISHGERLVAALLETAPGVGVGIDIAVRQSFGPGFLDTWFSPAEREWLAGGDAESASFVWAAKEAVYKASNDGERFAPRRIEILPGEVAGWQVRRDGRLLKCDLQSRTIDDDILVVAKYLRNES